MRDRYARIGRALREHPWAILPSVFEALLEIVEFRVEGGRLTAEEVSAKVGDRPDEESLVDRVGSVAVLPLHGVLAQRMNLFMQISGGTSTELFGKAFDEAFADPEVQAIVLSIDSPGGSAAGTEELASRIYAARQKNTKPIVAVADSLAASAAYHIGSQAHQFVASPGSQVGSIGVVISHVDVSKAEEARGIKTTLVAIPDAKVDGHPYAPLSEESRASVLSRIQPFYDLFVNAVARGRGVSASDVKDGYGQGRVLAAGPAKKAGMVDRIEARYDVIARLSTPQGRRAAMPLSAQPLLSEDGTTAQERSGATAQESPIRRELSAQLEQLLK